MFGRWRRVDLSSANGNLPPVHGCASPGWNVALVSSCGRSCSETRKILISKRPQLQEGKVLRLKRSKNCCHPGWEELQTRPIAAIDRTSKTSGMLDQLPGPIAGARPGLSHQEDRSKTRCDGGGPASPAGMLPACGCSLNQEKHKKKVGGGGAAAWRRSLRLQMNGVPKLRRHHCTPGPGGPSMRRSAFSCSALSWL